MLRAIREISPRYIVGENVRGLTNWNGGMVFDEICSELEAIGYQVAPVIIPACSVNAPHRRERIWFIAYTNGTEQRNNAGADNREAEEIRRKNKGDVSGKLPSARPTIQPESLRLQKPTQNGKMERSGFKFASQRNDWDQFPTQSPVCGGDDGLPTKLDGITFPKWRAESIKGYGNAIVPQVAYEIFKAIELSDKQLNLNYE